MLSARFEPKDFNAAAVITLWQCRNLSKVADISASSIASFRTVTMASPGTFHRQRLQEARHPDFDPARPYTGGWLHINASRFLGDGSFIISVADATLPAFAKNNTWSGAKIHIFPTRSWINIVHVSIKPLISPHDGSSVVVNGMRHFTVVCPPPSNTCTNTSNSASIGSQLLSRMHLRWL